MVIDRLGGIDPLKNVQSSQKTYNKSADASNSDSIMLSDEAKKMAEAYYLSETAAQTPDVRLDKIAEVKEKIKDPSYIDSTVIDTVADMMMDLFDL